MGNSRNWHKGQYEERVNAENKIHFPTDYDSIIKRIDGIDPGKYAKTRNFLNGAITYLSPYISRGVISTQMVFKALQAKGYPLYAMEKLVSELAWRDFFQRVWQAKGNLIFEDVKQPQPLVEHYKLPIALLHGTTGIDAIDTGIRQLFSIGYMHNHMRMYTASIACNIAGAHWKQPAQWMYYHLLDGDLASNHLSWQWVAGAFSSKKYYCNQENISKYTGSNQMRGYLAVDYGSFPLADIPEPLQEVDNFESTTTLPSTPTPTINPNLPVLLYNSYNLDPLWHAAKPANRILLFEPSHFTDFPVSEKVTGFVVELAQKNIPDIQVFSGEVNQIPFINQVPAVISKEHPAFTHYPGTKESRDWLATEVTGYFPSFFNYWKKIERQLSRK